MLTKSKLTLPISQPNMGNIIKDVGKSG